jgi:hypothetical protein
MVKTRILQNIKHKMIHRWHFKLTVIESQQIIASLYFTLLFTAVWRVVCAVFCYPSANNT